MVLIGATIFQIFTNMVGQGIVFGTISGKVRTWKNLIRNMWQSDGPDRGHHFPNIHQHGLAGNCIGDHFGTTEAM